MALSVSSSSFFWEDFCQLWVKQGEKNRHRDKTPGPPAATDPKIEASPRQRSLGTACCLRNGGWTETWVTATVTACLSKYLEKWGRREITVSRSDHRQKVNDPADLETWETCRSQNNDSCTSLTRRERWLELQRFSTV